ncbi:MAG: sulfite exporter TauE/SafE family protein [Bacteroides sp.]|nr:sulfite exporter TauE/SafE family protein [Bacteroides sp.]
MKVRPLRRFMVDLMIVGLFVLAMIVGHVDVAWLKIAASAIIPTLFYVLIVRAYGGSGDSRGSRLFHVGCCVALALAGVMGVMASNVRIPFSFLMLVGFILLTGGVGLRMLLRFHYKFGAVMLVGSLLIVIIPMILGYWPYSVVKAEKTVTHSSNYSFHTPEGYFLVKNNGKWGLRDRFGLLIDTDYDMIFWMSPNSGRYLLAVGNYGDDKERTRYVVYDLADRCYAVNPDNLDVAEMTVDSEDLNVYHLKDSNGRHFADFCITPSVDRGEVSDARFEPHFSESDVPLETFISKGYEMDECDFDDYTLLADMQAESPDAFRLLMRIAGMAALPSSATNDMRFGEAVRYFINEDSRYNGDAVVALNELDALIDGREQDTDECRKMCSDFRRILDTVRLSWAYHDLVGSSWDHLDVLNRQNIVNLNEYKAWHDFMEAFVYYLDSLDEKTDDKDSYEGIDNDLMIAMWLRDRAEAAVTDRSIIMGDMHHTISTYGLHSVEDVEAIFNQYHDDATPYAYHPVWNEIRPAFYRWTSARDAVEEYLCYHYDDESIADNYNRNTAVITDRMYDMLNNLPSGHP